MNVVLHHIPTSLSGVVCLLRTLQEERVSACLEINGILSVSRIFYFTPTSLRSSTVREANISRKSWHNACTLFFSSVLQKDPWHLDRLGLRSLYFLCSFYHLINTSLCGKFLTVLSLSKMTLLIIVAIFCHLGISILLHDTSTISTRWLLSASTTEARMNIPPGGISVGLKHATRESFLCSNSSFHDDRWVCLLDSLCGDTSTLLLPFLCFLLDQDEQVLLRWLHHGMGYSELSRLSGN